MNRPRLLALVLAGAVALSFVGLRGTRTQTGGLRRVTNTSEEGNNINPSISGDGRILAFESTEDVAHAGGTDHFRAIRSNIAIDPAAFFQMGGTRAVAPALSQDGSRIAFASKDDPLGANSDGNSEIFLFDGAKLIQVTNTSPGDVANRVTNGNFQPSITDDGRFIAFSSNRDLAGQNSDGNLEIFVYDAIDGNFTQLTNSSGMVGASEAKISGNGSSVAYIRDVGATPSAKRDLLEQPRAVLGAVTVLASNVQSLAMTYGRAISDDGTRVVYSAETATNSTQVFLFDGRFGAATRQITSLGVRATEVPLHPTISGDGLRIAFATRRSVSGTTSNSDGSVELYVFDIPSSQVSKITDVRSGVAADVVSSLNDDGSIAAFNFPRILSGAVSNSDSANNSEIYVTGTPARPPFGVLTVLNGAAFGKEPSPNNAVAPDSIAVAIGGALADSTQQPQRLPNGTFPTNVGGMTVTVNGRAAQIFFVSPGQVNFLVPPQTEIGTADVSVTNSENFASRGTVPTLRAAPGVFTKSGDGSGPGVILNSDTLQEGPFDPTSGNLRLTVFATGTRNATQNSVVIAGRVVAAESVIASPDMPGLDEVHVLVPRDLRGAGTVDLFVQSDSRAGNPVAVTFIGDATRDLLINEMLSDPPGAVATDVSGDANNDGVRSGSHDEFVELVNTTTHDIDISGYQLLTRSSSTTTDTLRHTFAASTIVPACTAVVVFGGGAFDANNPVFGGSKVVKASSGDLSLSNTGGVVTLRDQASGIVTSLSYGGSTGLNGNAGQSLTRAPDKTGNFVLHQAASGSGGRSFSPGTQLNGDPFALCNTFVRIDVSPSSAAVDAGAKQQFTAQAVNANGDEVPGVIFSWQSSNTSLATIDQNGLATSSTAGSTEIRASARGTQSAPATLTVREVQRGLTRVDVTPQSATIPATGAQQFTAKGIDQFGNEIAGLTFAWESSNTSAATIDQTGLASGVSLGQSTIKATSQNVSGTATLNVTAPTVVVNEVLADPPTGTDGDANHDGTRDSADDEFFELVNSTNRSINISGWTVRTHSTSSATETVRHTFAANTNFPAGEAMVVFGGWTFNAADPLFGCAQVVKASSGGLSLTNGGLTILVRDGPGNLVTQFSYGGTTGLDGGNAQSLTRSPDITGNFVLHTTVAGARKLSSGLKVDGTPFGNCTLLTINDVTLNEGNSGTTTFTFTVSLSTPAPSGGVTFDIATQDNTATVANNDYVARSLTGQTIAAGQQTYSFDVTVNGDLSIEPSEAFFVNVTNVSGAIVGDGQGVGTSLNDDSPILSINDVSANEGNAGTTTFTFTVSSTLSAPAGGITFDIATADGTATTAGGDYVARSLAGQTIPPGQTSYTFDVTVNGDTLFELNETFLVNVTNVFGASLSDGQGVGTIQNDDTPLVDISQLYGGGGNTGATYKNDFIEVFNRGNTTVDLAGWSVQYTSATGTGTWSVTPLCPSGPCLLLPGHYFLVQEDQGAGGTTNLPTPDAIGTISMTTGAGKVALSASTTTLSGACPSSPSILDVLGYGSSAACFEGTGPTAAPGNTTSVFRRSGGCTDTNDNAADSFVSAPFPRNSSSPTNNCIAGTPPNLTVDDVTVTEGNTGTVTATFTVSLSAPAPSTDVTFDIATQNNTALSGSDYVARTLTNQVIPAGQTTYTFSVIVNCDTTVEPDETFFVNVTNVTGATVTDGQGVATIQNDDFPTLSINDVSQNEGDSGTSSFHFTVSLAAPAPSAVTFDIATKDSTATVANNDYVTRSLTGQTIPAGQQTYGFDVTVNGDLNIEPNEAFFVNVTNISGATLTGGDGQGLGTIQNDDSPVLSINDVSVSEGNSGTTIVTFTVTSTLPAPAGGITFDIATQDNTATVANNDYVARSLTSQTIPATQTTYTFDVTVNGDLLVEPNETFFVNLSNPSGATIFDGQGGGTIQNDDTADLVISQVYGGGGNTSSPPAVYKNDFIEIFNRGTTTVDLAGWSVQYSSASNTATWSVTSLCPTGPCLLSPSKYFLVQEAQGSGGTQTLPTPDGTGTIAMATASGTVAIVTSTMALSGACPSSASILDHVGYGGSTSTTDFCYEGSAPAPAPGNTTADLRKSGGCTDTNDNAADFFVSAPFPRNTSSPANNCIPGTPPNLSINDVTISEGNSGTTKATFTVSLSAPAPSTDISFDIATQNNTATTANNDYVTRTLTNQVIPAGQTTYTFDVTVNGDTAVEPDETFFVNGTNVSGATVTDGQGVGTIQNDDSPTLSINDVSANEGNTGTSSFHFTVSLSAPAPAVVTFDIATQDGMATVANNDYVARSLTGQTIPAGQQTYGFDVTVNGDLNIEPNETFFVNVTNVSGATIVDGQGSATIQNDDSPVLSINDVLVSEGNSSATTLTFTVTSSLPAPAGGITFDIATQDNTATVANNDYVARSLTSQTIPATQTTYTFDVTVNGDLLVEPNETFFVNLSNPSGATIGDGQGVGTITNDETANLVISQVYGGGGNTGAPFANDFIELFNRGTATVDLAGWSVQYNSASGTDNWSVTPLCPSGPCLLLPGRYFLVREGATGTTNLPTPDATGTIAMATTSGKVALVSSTTALNGACPSNTNITDRVSYGGGTAATTDFCFEGVGPAPAPSNTTADFRKAGGCTDTDQNAADFFVSGPFPRNTSSPVNNCTAGAPPNLTINDVTVAEGNSGTTTATFTVSLSAPAPSTDVTFDIATQNNTATTANSDYVLKSLTSQIIPAGETTYTFSVTVNGDVAVEPDETFFVNGTNVSGATVTDGQGVGTIQNDDFPTLSINDVSANEGNAGTTTFSFNVSLSAPAPSAVTFDIATQDNTATVANNDYVARTLSGQTIAAGQQTYAFDVTVNGDLSIELNETFLVNVTNVSGAIVADGQGTGTILNDDSPALSINDVSANEGDIGTTVFTFTVTLSLPAPSGGITFDIATADDTAHDDNPASEDNDYVARVLTNRTIPAGQTSYTFDATVNGDKLVEPNETFFVNISNVSGASTSDGQGLGTIQNDDTANLSISQIYPGGGLTSASFTNDFTEIFNRSTTTVDFAVTPYSVQFLSTGAATWAKTDLTSGTLAPGRYFLIKESGGAVGAALPTPDVTGTINLTSTTSGKVALVASTTLLTGNCPGDDGTTPFNPVNGTVADFVGYGSTAATANHCYEGTGPASFTLGNNTTADFRKAGGCTDTNDNAADFFVSGPFPRNTSSPANNCTAGAPPNLTINDVTVAEGDSGTTTAAFIVSLAAPAPSTDVTFDIATQNNTALSGSDYVASTLTNLVIPAGQTTYTFDVTVNGDTGVEPDEAFFVNVTNVTGATVTDGQGLGTIQHDDLPTLSIDDISATEGNSGPKTFTFHVTLSAAAPATVTFDIATADGTAQDGVPGGEDNDYAAHSITAQTIAAGATSFNFDVIVNGDLNVEPNEAFFVNVTSVSGATIVDGQGAGTIQNDDSPVLSINDVSVSEGNSSTTTLTFTVTSSLPAPAGGITFDIATQDNTATVANSDYVARSLNSQTILATQTTYTFDVTVNGDLLVEPNETFFVNLGSPSGATSGDGQGVGTITNDDTANLVISQVYGGGNNSGALYQNDFVEILNRGTTTVDLSVTPYSLQYAGVGSNFGPNKTNLTTGAIAPGRYFLIQESGGTTNGVALPSPDATGSIAMGNTSGKVALVVGTAALQAFTCPGDDGASPFNPSDSLIADFVGYGNTAAAIGHCYEGAAPATAPSNTTADFRRAGGCANTNDNAADFLVSGPFPRNSSSPINDCTTADFEITKTDSPDPVMIGSDLTYTITVTNLGPATSQSVVVTDNLPGTVTFVSCASTGGGVCGGTGNNRTITFSSLAGGASATITFVGTANGAGGTTIDNTATVASATSDPDAGNNSASATTSVQAPAPTVASVVVLPSTATINRGNAQQFTATAFDASNQPIPGATFTWSSSVTALATIDSTGLATAVGIGTTTITATTDNGTGGTISGTATLTVQVPVVINEALPQVPTDNAGTTAIEGDSNRDGVRSSGDDEFVELLNNSTASVDVSGVVIADSTSNRFTFPANTILTAGRAAVVFGGGSPPVNDPALGGALIFKTTSTLSLADGGDSITVKLAVSATDVTIDSLAYGTGNPVAAPGAQALTRSPDAEIGLTGGAFVTHTTATNAAGRVFSPGTRADGTPFGSPALTRIGVVPASASINTGATQGFTAHAYSNVGGPEIEVLSVSFIWDSSDTTKATVAAPTGQSTTATGVAAGSPTIRARAGGQEGTATLTVNSVVASIDLTPDSASVNVNGSQIFTATARDASSNVITGITFTFSLRTPSPANAATITATNGNTVTVRGDNIGSVTVVANYTRPSDSVILEDTTLLTITSAPAPSVPTAGQVIINEALISFASGAGRAKFLELYNTTSQSLDISGMVISFRAGGAGNTPSTVTLPGTVGSNTTVIAANSYFLIVNGASTFSVNADYNSGTGNLDLNGTGGGIKIEVNGVKLDGLTYQGSATAINATFVAYGEGPIFTFTATTTSDLVRSSTSTDTNNNASDFRLLSSTTTVTPKAVNPP